MSLINQKSFKTLSEQPLPLNTAKALGGLGSGPRDLNGDGKIDEMEKWASEFKGWLVQARDHGETIDWNQTLNYIRYASDKMGVEWDPLGEMGWSPDGGEFSDSQESDSDMSQVNSFGGELGLSKGSYTYDSVETEIGFTGKQTRNDVFGSRNKLNLDMPSAEVNCEITKDKGVEVLKVVVKTSKGEAVYFYDNFKNPDFKLKIRAADLNKVKGAEVLPGKIEVSKYDGKQDPSKKTAETQPPADRESDTERVWNTGSAVDYFMSPGTGIDRFFLSAADFHPEDRTQKVYITKKGPHSYEIVYTDASGDLKHPLRTIEAEQISSLNFKDTFAGNIFFRDMSAEATAPTLNPSPSKSNIGIVKTGGLLNPNGAPTTPTSPNTDFHAWDQFAQSPDAQIAVEGYSAPAGSAAASDGQVVNLDAANDTASDSVQGTTANYSNKDNVDLTALSTTDANAVQKYEITDVSKVTLNKTPGTHASVKITPNADGSYTVTFSSGGKKSQIFHISKGTKINLGADLKSDSVIYNGADYTPGVDANLSVKGEEFPAMATSLSDWMKVNGVADITPAKIIQDANSAKNESGFDLAELQYPSIPPSDGMIAFLRKIDPAFDHYSAAITTGGKSKDKFARAQFRDRLVELLKMVYPNIEVRGNGTSGNGDNQDDLFISGQFYDIIDNDGSKIRFKSSDTDG